jgi:hypothetical protein
MSPLYNSQVLTNTPLQSVGKGDAVLPLLFSAETPLAGQASLAVALQPSTVSSGPEQFAIELRCPGGIGAGVFQIQDADTYDATGTNFTSINFNGLVPGQIDSTSVNASGTARVELTARARFVRLLCVTAPGAAVTVTVSK